MATNLVDMDDFRHLREQEVEVRESTGTLKGGDGGGTSDTMVPLKDYVDKADEALESRLNARFEKLLTTDQFRAGLVTAVFSILGVLLAVLAFAGDRFDAGISLSSANVEQRKRDDAQDRKLDEILRRLPPPAQPQGK